MGPEVTLTTGVYTGKLWSEIPCKNSGFVLSSNFQQFSDLKKVWKMEIKSKKNRKQILSFFKATTNSVSQLNIFSFRLNLILFARMFSAYMYLTYLITLSLEKEFIVSEKSLGKVLNLFPGICAKH